MESSYPKNLIDKITRYFKVKYGQEITELTAVEYLDSLAGLYASFTEILDKEAISAGDM